MAVQISGNDITVPRDGSFTRNVTIGGTLTYEDVTNIDSVGLVTARNGIEIGARPGVAASISVDGNMIVSGISTFGGDVQVPDKIIHSGDTNTKIRFPAVAVAPLLLGVPVIGRPFLVNFSYSPNGTCHSILPLLRFNEVSVPHGGLTPGYPFKSLRASHE